jgi:hypothetical protein
LRALSFVAETTWSLKAANGRPEEPGSREPGFPFVSLIQRTTKSKYVCG